MKRNVNYTICLLGAMLILCQACRTRHESSSLVKGEEDYEATIEGIFWGLYPCGEKKDSVLEDIELFLNVQNTPKYARHLWVGNEKGENVGGYLYMVHHQDTFRMDCECYISSGEEIQYQHYLNRLSFEKCGNPDFERFQRKLRKHDDHYKESVAKFFKEAEFYVMADSASFAEHIRKEYGGATDIGYPKGKIKAKRRVPFMIVMKEVSQMLEPHYSDYIIIFPDSTIYQRHFETR